VSIQLVALSEYPLVGAYAGRPFASHGVVVDWPAEKVRGRWLSDDMAKFYAELLEEPPSQTEWRMDPAGRFGRRLVSTSMPIAIGAIPGKWMKRPTNELRRIRRLEKRVHRYWRLFEHSAAREFAQQALFHGLVNANGQIRGAADALRGGDRNEKHLINIEKACFQVSSILSSAKILSPEWKAPKSAPFHQIHPSVTAQMKRWVPEFRDRGLRMELGRCHSRIEMESDVLGTVLDNIFSNIYKYAQRCTLIQVIFVVGPRTGLDVVFEMTSQAIVSSDPRSILALGARFSSGNVSGTGVGLALVDRAMTVYGGSVEVIAGSPDPTAPEFAKNVFVLKFPKSRTQYSDGY